MKNEKGTKKRKKVYRGHIPLFFQSYMRRKGILDLHLQRDMSEEARGEIEAIKRAVERIERTVKNVVRRGEIHE